MTCSQMLPKIRYHAFESKIEKHLGYDMYEVRSGRNKEGSFIICFPNSFTQTAPSPGFCTRAELDEETANLEQN